MILITLLLEFKLDLLFTNTRYRNSGVRVSTAKKLLMIKIFLLIVLIWATKITKIAKTVVKSAEKAIEMPSSNRARREAMRLAKIPTSMVPFEVTKNLSGRQYQYLKMEKGGV